MKTTILRLLLGFALILPVMATEAAVRVSPAGSIEVNGAQFSPLGVEIRSLSELSQIGPEIREAGFNCVLSSMPRGAAAIPGMWEAHDLGLMVIQHSAGLGEPAPNEYRSGDWVRTYYEYSSWARSHPAYLGWMFERRDRLGVKPEQMDAYALAAKAGNPEGLVIFEVGAYEPAETVVRTARFADAVAVAVHGNGAYDDRLAQPWLESGWQALLSASPGKPVFAFLPGTELRENSLTVESLLQVARSARQSGADGLFFPPAANERIWEVQKQVARQLAAELPALVVTVSREQVLAEEASRPLLWTLRRCGEISGLNGLEEYRTPDESVGYQVTEPRAFLSLAIPNRSGLVDASQLTRFSMRMFSTVEAPGVLIALSTANEVSYTPYQIEGGWHTYEIDLTSAPWGGQTPATSRWGGSSGQVQGLTLTPPATPGAQVAFDWIRLEPASEGELLWEMESLAELSSVEELEGLQVAEGELRGKAQGQYVRLELTLPQPNLPVDSLPLLSLRANCSAEGWAEVEYWWPHQGKMEEGGTARFRIESGWQSYCVDLSGLGFAGARLAGGARWGGPWGQICRLRLTLPAQPGEEMAVDWIRLGPNYDLRVGLEEPPPELTEE